MERKILSLRFTEDHKQYKITNWLALNQENLTRYNELMSLAERVQMLERILVNHILSFASGLDWFIEERINVTITKLEGPHPFRFKGMRFRAFNPEFTVNLELPSYIGLGKGSSIGFGVVKQVHHGN